MPKEIRPIPHQRTQLELRPAENNTMKRSKPEFGYHKNWIHPWSLFQKGCALQYRFLADEHQLQKNLIIHKNKSKKVMKNIVKEKFVLKHVQNRNKAGPRKRGLLSRSPSNSNKAGPHSKRGLLSRSPSNSNKAGPSHSNKSGTSNSNTTSSSNSNTTSSSNQPDYNSNNNSKTVSIVTKSYNNSLPPPTKNGLNLSAHAKKERINTLTKKLIKNGFNKNIARAVARKMIKSGRPSEHYVKKTGKTKSQ